MTRLAPFGVRWGDGVGRSWRSRKPLYPLGTVGSNPTPTAMKPGGEVTERSKVRDWKSRVRDERTEGSNPSLSAIRLFFERCDSRGCSSVGRALPSQGRGRRFEPAHLHQESQVPSDSPGGPSRHTSDKLYSGTLDGELAVPCDPQSATAGSNIHPRPRGSGGDLRETVLKARSRAIGIGESGQGREAAAVSRSPDVPRGRLAGAGCRG